MRIFYDLEDDTVIFLVNGLQYLFYSEDSKDVTEEMLSSGLFFGMPLESHDFTSNAKEVFSVIGLSGGANGYTH